MNTRAIVLSLVIFVNVVVIVYGIVLLGLGINGAANPQWRDKLLGGVVTELNRLKISTSAVDKTFITASTVVFPLIVVISTFAILFATVSLVSGLLILFTNATSDHRIQYLITYVNCFSILLIIGQLVIGSLAVSFEVKEKFTDPLTDVILSQINSTNGCEALNYLQTEFDCCENLTNYNSCERDCIVVLTVTKVGCREAFSNSTRKLLKTVANVTFAFMAFEVMSVLSGCCMISSIGSLKKFEGWGPLLSGRSTSRTLNSGISLNFADRSAAYRSHV